MPCSALASSVDTMHCLLHAQHTVTRTQHSHAPRAGLSQNTRLNGCPELACSTLLRHGSKRLQNSTCCQHHAASHAICKCSSNSSSQQRHQHNATATAPAHRTKPPAPASFSSQKQQQHSIFTLHPIHRQNPFLPPPLPALPHPCNPPSTPAQFQSLICQSSITPPAMLGSVAAATATLATWSTDTGGTKPAPTTGRAASCLACAGGSFFSSRSTGPKMAPRGRVMAELQARTSRKEQGQE